MSSRAESKTTSFSSLTLRLKGKLQLQRLRHSERVKLTQREEEHTHTLQSECELDVQQRAVLSSLHYFKALVDRLGVDRPGVDRLVQDQSVVGRLLGRASNRVLEAVETLVQESQLHNSRDMSSCLDHLYQSVAQLVHWVDQVILQGVAHDDKESTASVITVIRGLLDAIKELERLAGSAPSSPVQSQPPVEQTGQTEDRGTSCPVEDEWRTEQTEDEPTVCAPPKPAMPRLQAPPPEGLSPPALPPKKRHSLPGPALCRVAIVAPMRREPESLTQEQEDCDDDCLKQCSSSSSADSDVDNTHCDDPDYDFLHTDLSSSETLPPLPPSSLLPPALPEKRRRSSAGTTMSQTPTSFDFDSAPKNQDPAPCDDVTDSLDPVSSPLSPCKSPPPLPEKKRHIHQYLQLLSSYNAESTAMFYQTPPTLSHSNRHRETDSAHLGSGHAPSPELLPAPALPPKKKQQDSAEDDTHTENESGDSLQQEEVLLTNQKEILHRITMKSEEEEGPDVKAASPEILMVYALDPELDLFQEAFLSTYRTFISPCDVITKLQHRYPLRNLREDRDAAKRTFSLLVRVVDELCVMELDSDLLLLLVELVFSLLIGGELKRAYLLRSNVLTKMEQKWRLTGSPGSLRPLAAKGVAARPGTLLDFRSQDLAEQLTLMDSDLFYKIELPEVLLWSKEQNEEKSPNLTEFTQHFNNVSFWVRSIIILQDKPQDRERLLLKFLKIMKHLRKLNNFNSYLSILSALDSAPLRRLDWQRSTSEALEEYSSLIDSSSSFKAYRAALSEVEPPCIPYLGLILQDLTFVHLGNSDSLMTSQGSKVNFSKRWQQFNILYTLKSYQQVPYSLQPNDDIIHFFNDFSDHLAEEALWELSLRIRPRNVPRTNQR